VTAVCSRESPSDYTGKFRSHGATQMFGIQAKQYRGRMPFCSHKRCGNSALHKTRLLSEGGRKESAHCVANNECRRIHPSSPGG
jgi:hypothetical protein